MHFERVDLQEITVDDFEKNYLRKEKGLILINALCNWGIYKKFYNIDEKEREKLLVELLGDAQVPVVYDKDAKSEGLYGNNVKENMKITEFFNVWKDRPFAYLKDFHFVPVLGESAYDIPLMFKNDWLNEYCVEEQKSDYKFMYLGASGTQTRKHKDVLQSYSWSANVFGKKLWRFYCKQSTVEVVQESNEIIFVPSGLEHEVYNMEDTLSINQNWFNEYCIEKVCRFLMEEYAATCYSLRDIRTKIEPEIDTEYEKTVQKIMTLNTGLNLEDFLHILRAQQKKMSRDECLSYKSIQILKCISQIQKLSYFNTSTPN
eukprot:snap_masked-scaffold_27-processed-gene-1.21-mRNA-1 protein AED:0.34 eAED:0.34 QI:0/-1/0/1/-1/1/1/0/316